MIVELDSLLCTPGSCTKTGSRGGIGEDSGAFQIQFFDKTFGVVLIPGQSGFLIYFLLPFI